MPLFMGMPLCLLHCMGLYLYLGLVEGDTPVSDIKLPCRTRPHWLEPAIYPSETDRASPSEGIGLEDHSMLSVAVKISSQNTERNVKVGTPHLHFYYWCALTCASVSNTSLLLEKEKPCHF